MERIDTTFCGHCREEKLVDEFSWMSKAKGTLQSWCKACVKAYEEAYRKTPKCKAYKKAYMKVYSKVYSKTPKNKVYQKTYMAEYKKTPKNKVYQADYAKNNPGKMIAKTRKRKAAKLHRTPKWVDLKAVELFYINCPKGLEVDHIIPLQGKLVSGLHVLSNLQYLTKSENSAKNNKFDPIEFNNL